MLFPIIIHLNNANAKLHPPIQPLASSFSAVRVITHIFPPPMHVHIILTFSDYHCLTNSIPPPPPFCPPPLSSPSALQIFWVWLSLCCLPHYWLFSHLIFWSGCAATLRPSHLYYCPPRKWAHTHTHACASNTNIKIQAALLPFVLYDALSINEYVVFLCFCLLHAECPNAGQC